MKKRTKKMLNLTRNLRHWEKMMTKKWNKRRMKMMKTT